jgi:hypothetical protein
VLQLVQLLYTIEHVKQVLLQSEHIPLYITKGDRHTDTQVPSCKAAVPEQPIHVLTVPEHVAHTLLHGSQ